MSDIAQGRKDLFLLMIQRNHFFKVEKLARDAGKLGLWCWKPVVGYVVFSRNPEQSERRTNPEFSRHIPRILYLPLDKMVLQLPNTMWTAGELCSNTLTWKDLRHINPSSDKTEMLIYWAWNVTSLQRLQCKKETGKEAIETRQAPRWAWLTFSLQVSSHWGILLLVYQGAGKTTLGVKSTCCSSSGLEVNGLHLCQVHSHL